ncbi:MAG: Txe/YoeB family addiction module toxin [Desulfobacterium sp.]
MSWKVILSKKAVKDSKKIKSAGLKPQTERLLRLLSENPLQSPPAYEKLVGNLNGFYSRRINIQHRLVYDIDKTARIVHVFKMWTHYE